jgi:hypothetical protein
MARSTKADKARQLNAAYALLQRKVALPEAMQRLSREFALSERQAYRYLEEASHLDQPVEVSEAAVPITLKLPVGTARLLRAYARSSGLDHRSDRGTRAGRVFRYSEGAWLSGANRTARWKFTLNMHLIACTIRSSSRPTGFWRPFESVPLAGV